MLEDLQRFCPKCHRMYCEGDWGIGICAADMHFGREPTAAGDAIAQYVRAWYERNRESWWDRHVRWSSPLKRGDLADNFMLRLLAEVARVQAARAAERSRHA